MLAAYCLRRAGEPGPDGVTGLDGEPVRLLEAEGLGLWVSPGAPGRREVERLRAHDTVVLAALRTATPLPLRFGATFADEESARAALRARREEWLEALDRVAGRVEMSVQVIGELPSTGAPADAAPVRTGREFLEARRRRLDGDAMRRGEAVRALERVARPFEDLKLPAVRVVAPAPGVVGSIAHLVPLSELGRYRAVAAEAARGVPPLRVRISGPWAPYSFV